MGKKKKDEKKEKEEEEHSDVNMATGPKVAESPLEILSDTRHREIPLLHKYWYPVVGATLGFFGVIVGNYASKRPMMSGIQKHVMVAGSFGVLAKWFDDWRDGYLAEKDAILKHYVELHPDDFPPYERKKYADVLEPWVPIR